MNEPISMPVKTREMHSHHFDSTIWNDFEFRDDDIIVSTYAKAGTTWMQQIISQLKADMPGEIRRIADSLDIEIREESWEKILLHCSFDYMKNNATRSTPLAGAFWDDGAKVFINKGVNGRWTDTLPAEDSERYERTAVEELGEECARWLATGAL